MYMSVDTDLQPRDLFQMKIARDRWELAIRRLLLHGANVGAKRDR